MSFSFLYEWAIPLIVFSLSLRALDEPGVQCARLGARLRGGSVRGGAVLRYPSRASRRRDSVFPARRSHLPCHGSAGVFLAGAMLGDRYRRALACRCTWRSCAMCVVMLPLFLHLQKRFESPGMLGVAGALGSVAAEIGAEARSGSEVPSREGLAGSVLAQEAWEGSLSRRRSPSPSTTWRPWPRPSSSRRARPRCCAIWAAADRCPTLREVMDPFQEHHRDAH